MTDESRNPASFLELLKSRERGKLKVYIGSFAGVGKTYRMLQEGHDLRQGIDAAIQRRLVDNIQAAQTMGLKSSNWKGDDVAEAISHSLARKTPIERNPMTTRVMNPKVDAYIAKAKKWRAEFEKLRAILLDCQLTEELKWGHPCYTFQDKNIVVIHGFKEYCALLFFKGALLKDPQSILVQQTEHVQSARQIRFTGVREIVVMKPTLKRYVNEAIAVEKAGLKVDFKKTTEFTTPEEFQKRLDKNRALKAAFTALTPGRQRAYLLYFSAPKQSKTRESRIEKYVPHILDGKGLND